MISKALRQSDLHHNPDPLGRLVGEANESKVKVEGQETRELLDSGSQLSAISWTWVGKLNLEPKQLQSILRIEVQGVWRFNIGVMWRFILEYQKLRLLIKMYCY